MLTFRQKIFLNYVLIFLIFALVLYLVIPQVIESLQKKHVEKVTQDLLVRLENSSSLSQMVNTIDSQKNKFFFRVMLLDASKVVYDTHASLSQKMGEEESFLQSPEVVEALKQKHGFSERYSKVFSQQMSYVAIAFEFEGKKLVLRVAFPYGRIDNLLQEFTVGLLGIGMLILLLFGAAAWSIIHYFTRPIRRIIELITPYQLGKEEDFPEIIFDKEMQPNDEFGKLARILNSLSRRIKSQIDVLIQEKNEKARILDSLTEGVVTVDAHFFVTYANKVAQQFLKIPLENLLFKKFPKEASPLCHELLTEVLKTNESATDVYIASRPQRTYWDLIALPQKNIGAILVLQDKTSLHKVVELGKDFVANASHELKTPITIIRGFAETLHDYPHLSEQMLKDITEKIVANCNRMHTLVKNLLTLSALDEDLPLSRVQEFDLVDLAKEAQQIVETAYPTAQISIESDENEDYLLYLDGDLFLQALINLIDNAAKYSKAPAKIEVILSKEPEMMKIQIKDHGQGIPKEDLERIFERFYAVDKSHSKSLGGSGLGLSIVERIIYKHKGLISVDSEFGKGTVFTIEVPYKRMS